MKTDCFRLLDILFWIMDLFGCPAFCILLLVQLGHGCFLRWSETQKELCSNFPDDNYGCTMNRNDISQGESRTNDMAVGLYQSVTTDETLDQENIIIFPTEIARTLSVLMIADHPSALETDGEGPAARLSESNQIRCYVNKQTEEMFKLGLLAISDEQEKYMKEKLNVHGNSEGEKASDDHDRRKV